MHSIIWSLALVRIITAQPGPTTKSCQTSSGCSVGFYCTKQKSCSQLFLLKDECTYSEQCGPYMFCRTGNGSSVCAHHAAPKEPCQIDSDCRDSLFCGPEKACRYIRHLNEVCSFENECNEGLNCHKTRRRCVVATTTTISSSKATATPGTDTNRRNATTGPSQMFQPCSSTRDCASFLYCNITAPFRCIKKSWQSRCHDNSDCYKGFGCTNGVCQRYKQADEYCNSEVPCAENLFCNKGNRCQTRGTVDIDPIGGWTRSLLHTFQQFANGTRLCGGLTKDANAACFQRHIKAMAKCTLSRGREYSMCMMDSTKIANMNAVTSMAEIIELQWRGYEYTQQLKLTPVRGWDCRSGNGYAWFLLNYNMPNINHPLYVVYECHMSGTPLTAMIQRFANMTASAIDTCKNNKTCETTTMTRNGCPEYVTAGADSWCVNPNPFVNVTDTLIGDTYLSLLKFNARFGSTNVRVSQFYGCQNHMAWFRLDLTGDNNMRATRWVALRCPIDYTEVLQKRIKTIANAIRQCGKDSTCLTRQMSCSFYSASSSACYDYSIPRVPIQTIQSSAALVSHTTMTSGTISVELKRVHPCSNGFTWVEFIVKHSGQSSRAWALYYCRQ